MNIFGWGRGTDPDLPYENIWEAHFAAVYPWRGGTHAYIYSNLNYRVPWTEYWGWDLFKNGLAYTQPWDPTGSAISDYLPFVSVGMYATPTPTGAERAMWFVSHGLGNAIGGP